MSTMTEGLQVPPECQPQPHPVTWVTSSHPSGFVVIRHFDVSGEHVLILSAADAQSYVDSISQHIPTARSGLIVPGGAVR